jgi:uncharacterized lipoprotein YddW (UPF0748 family)
MQYILIMKKIIWYILLLILFLQVNSIEAHPKKREFRGSWLATVNNLDWPSKAGEPTKIQKKELVDILDTLEKLNFNALIFQIRPTADAFYHSKTEPWSAYLTGQQGKAPDENWDPLMFMADECHKRGMELHAWMNPFRIQQNLTDKLNEKNVALRHPDWVVTYGTKTYLDPGIPAVRDYLISVVEEVVSNYEIDAIHFDDYFYPYPIVNMPFPDTLSFKLYNRGFPATEIENWRRANVDSIIFSLSQTIKKINPSVKFGISPFGVWENYNIDYTGSVTSAGTTNFSHLFADVVKWQQNGWIDYLIPQIYWEIGHPTVDYITLANWWNEKAFDRHIYIGHALYKLNEGTSPAWKSDREMPEQILISRKLNNIEGNAFFRMKYINMNPYGFKDRLQNDLYKLKALVPVMPWLDSITPVPPKRIVAQGFLKKNRIAIKYTKKLPASSDLQGYLVYTSGSKDSIDTDDPGGIWTFTPESKIKIDELKLPSKKTFYIWITAIDRQHNESAPVGRIRIRRR